MGISSMRPQLSEQDIERLMKGETPDERAGIAHKLCRRIATDPLNETERHHAEEIIAILAEDAAELVREAIRRRLGARTNGHEARICHVNKSFGKLRGDVPGAEDAPAYLFYR